MNRDQVKQLFKRIKALYDKFSMSTEKIDEWLKILKNYSNDGINYNFDTYIKENHEEPPRVVNLINEFIAVEQKKQGIYCEYCKKRFTLENYEEFENHMARHSSVHYIKSREHLINQNYDVEKLMNMLEKKFQEAYDKFIGLIVNLIIEPNEHRRLQNIIKANQGEKIIIGKSDLSYGYKRLY